MASKTTILIALMTLTVGLAGCIGDEADGGDTGQAGPADPSERTFVPEPPSQEIMDQLPVMHADHQNPESHTQAVGLEVEGHTDMTSVHPTTVQGGWTEVDLHGDLAAVASYYGDAGVTLVDVSDPSGPEPVSLIPSAGRDYDARFSQDGRYLFFGCQASEQTQAPQAALGDCTTTTGPDGAQGSQGFTSGVMAYNVSDPEAPTFVGGLEGVATHNLWTETIDGTIHIFTNAVEILAFDPAADQPMEQVAQVPGGHDAFVHEHPVTGDILLYTTGGDGSSFAVYNVTDPTDPQVLVETGPDVVGWHKQVASDTLVDGRALLVVGGEVFADQAGTLDGTQPPMISVLDVTDPAQPETLSQWTLPVSDLPPWTHYRFSPHNIDISPYGQVYVAWNHGGAWVFDVSTQQRQAEPVTLGFYQPHESPPPLVPTLNPTGDPSIPRVWGGMFDHRGYLVVPDMYTGVYVLEPAWGLFPGR